MAAVWYVGLANRRLITAADWAREHISAGDVEWKASNGWSIPQAQFTQAQLDYLLEQQNFVIDAPEGPRDGVVIPEPPPPPGTYPPGSTIKVITEIPGLTLRFGHGPLPADPSEMPKTVYIVVPT